MLRKIQSGFFCRCGTNISSFGTFAKDLEKFLIKKTSTMRAWDDNILVYSPIWVPSTWRVDSLPVHSCLVNGCRVIARYYGPKNNIFFKYQMYPDPDPRTN